MLWFLYFAGAAIWTAYRWPAIYEHWKEKEDLKPKCWFLLAIVLAGATWPIWAAMLLFVETALWMGGDDRHKDI